MKGGGNKKINKSRIPRFFLLRAAASNADSNYRVPS